MQMNLFNHRPIHNRLRHNPQLPRTFRRPFLMPTITAISKGSFPTSQFPKTGQIPQSKKKRAVRAEGAANGPWEKDTFIYEERSFF
jgi:hypothetical protein